MSKYLFSLSLVFLFCGLPEFAHGQSATASLSGFVTDPQGRPVAGARVILTDLTKNVRLESSTTTGGRFSFSHAQPSQYVVRVQQAGFATAEVARLTLNVNDDVTVRLELQIAARGEAVVVRSELPVVSESPAVSTVVDRQFIENQPLNGRSFQTLVELSPGVVLTPSSLPTAGQFSVNGQRTSSNYFTVDGVSGNFGSTASVTLYESAGGSIPSYSALGTTTSLASVDAVQEFSIQTSTYARSSGDSRAVKFPSLPDPERTNSTEAHLNISGTALWTPTTISPTRTGCKNPRRDRMISASPWAARFSFQLWALVVHAITTAAIGHFFSPPMKVSGCVNPL